MEFGNYDDDTYGINSSKTTYLFILASMYLDLVKEGNNPIKIFKLLLPMCENIYSLLSLLVYLYLWIFI